MNDSIKNVNKEQFFNELMEKDYGAYYNFPYTYPSFTMIGFFQRLFKIKSKYYKKYKLDFK